MGSRTRGWHSGGAEVNYSPLVLGLSKEGYRLKMHFDKRSANGFPLGETV
jgi:hypothetical protein